MSEYHELQKEIEQLRSDLDLRNQTALDRKEIIAKLEAEIEQLTAENAELRAALQIWMQGPSRALEGK